MHKNCVILLTACINPNGMAYTALQDKEVRLQQYREALDWYLAHVECNIVFVENSGYDISPLYESYIRSGRLEVLTFQGNDYDKSWGKGYGEALIIEYALNNSVILKKNDNVIKITGRLICRNIKRMINNYTASDVIYGIRSKDPEGFEAMESQIIVAPYTFWKDYFVPRKDSINDSKHHWFEHLLFETLTQWISNGKKYREMWLPLKIYGVSGSSGKSVNAKSLNNPVVFYIYYVLHRFGYYGRLKFWA